MHGKMPVRSVLVDDKDANGNHISTTVTHVYRWDTGTEAPMTWTIPVPQLSPIPGLKYTTQAPLPQLDNRTFNAQV